LVPPAATERPAMKTKAKSTLEFKTSRRGFLVAGGALALAAPNVQSQSGAPSAPPVQTTGNGEWTYRTVPGWGHLPAGIEFGGTHGGITSDAAGNIYISTQSAT